MLDCEQHARVDRCRERGHLWRECEFTGRDDHPWTWTLSISKARLMEDTQEWNSWWVERWVTEADFRFGRVRRWAEQRDARRHVDQHAAELWTIALYYLPRGIVENPLICAP